MQSTFPVPPPTPTQGTRDAREQASSCNRSLSHTTTVSPLTQSCFSFSVLQNKTVLLCDTLLCTGHLELSGTNLLLPRCRLQFCCPMSCNCSHTALAPRGTAWAHCQGPWLHSMGGHTSQLPVTATSTLACVYDSPCALHYLHFQLSVSLANLHFSETLFCFAGSL